MLNSCFNKNTEFIIAEMVEKRKAIRIWFATFCMATIAVFAQSSTFMSLFEKLDRFLMVDSAGIYHWGKLNHMESGIEIVDYCSDLALRSFFERRPKGLKDRTLFKQLFYGAARKKSKRYYSCEEKYFKEREVTQTFKESKSRLLPFRDGFIHESQGVLIRSGNYRHQQFQETLRYTIRLYMMRNHYHVINGHLPYVCMYYELNQEEPSKDSIEGRIDG